MDYYFLQEHLHSLVREFKDKEKTFGQDGYATDQLAAAILEYVQYISIRQPKLFAQQRGEEFERMMIQLEKKEHNMEAVKRFLDDDDLWQVTLEVGEQ
jgi:hypothetical protein